MAREGHELSEVDQVSELFLQMRDAIDVRAPKDSAREGHNQVLVARNSITREDIYIVYASEENSASVGINSPIEGTLASISWAASSDARQPLNWFVKVPSGSQASKLGLVAAALEVREFFSKTLKDSVISVVEPE
jgi:hypothetical protein